MKYTKEQFASDLEAAQMNPESREKILQKGLDDLDIDKDVKEIFLKYKDDLLLMKAKSAEKTNTEILSEIENGTIVLYKCIKEVPNKSYKIGQDYYVKIEDLSLLLEGKKDVPNWMNPLIWIIKDKKGLKSKNILGLGDNITFSDYFELVPK